MIGEAGSEMKMVYLNAVPRDHYGYNDMTSAEERVRVFNSMLEKAEDRFQPEKIFVACGSLSALLDEVPYVDKHRQKVQGIGWIGRQLLMESIQEKPDAPVFVFATPVTISEGLYSATGLSGFQRPEVYIEQPCPGLANQISSKLEERAIFAEIMECCQKALESAESDLKFNSHQNPIVFLGCTHYSFRAALFVEAFAELGFPRVTLLDPVPASALSMAQDPFCSEGTDGIRIEFISPYRLPDVEQKTIATLLDQISPITAEAFRSGRVMPELAD
jgi:glutamate racemase